MLADGELPLLQLLGLRKHFGGVRAVDGVDLVIRAGELCCVIGPNGAGKSTLFQLLSGQLLPTAGRVVFDGKDITRAQPFERGRLGIAVKVQSLGVFRTSRWIITCGSRSCGAFRPMKCHVRSISF